MRGRLLRLMDSWGWKQRQIAGVEKKIAGASSRTQMKPSLYKKIRKFMDQLAFFRKKEEAIISEIERIEKKHRQMRRKKALKAAQKLQRDNERAAQKKKNRYFWWWVVLILWIMDNENKKLRAAGLKPSPR